MCKLVFRHWEWSSNGMWCNKGTRIIIGWNHNDVDVMVLHQDDQVIHTRIRLKRENKEVFCSFIYAHNEYQQRRTLWEALRHHNAFINNRPWCLFGDFNATLFLEESTSSSSRSNIAMREFKECVNSIDVVDVNRSGLHFTWNQKPKGDSGILKKLDRIMANLEFASVFVGAHAIFKPYRNSDHSPAVLCLPTAAKNTPKPFKFFNVLTKHERFLSIVQEYWNQTVSGFHMYGVVQKLKCMKKPFRKLLFDKGNLHTNVIRLRDDLDRVQTLLDQDPFNINIREQEALTVADFNQAVIMEEHFLRQKAKVQWLKEGDSNSAYFHKTVKSNACRGRIDAITTSNGVILTDDNVSAAFVSHYESFLGQSDQPSDLNDTDLFEVCIDEQVAADMVRGVSDREIKEAMFSIGDDKAPGPDGYSAAFFKEAWSIVGTEVIKAIREFFINGKLLKELNHTIIALIPKVKTPSKVNDYRPISCCNVLFKCISKVIANRMKNCLSSLISSNQSAFVPGRSIADNILLTQELMHNYHLDRGEPRCAFKVDIQKAYDTVDWSFLRKILIGFRFPARMVIWIMECVSTTSYSICINGNLHGYFRGGRGLRQGDPLSPYLFTLVMEILTRMLKRRVMDSHSFCYHRYCEKVDLINLCFADDLFLFAYGNVDSARVIKESLDEFKLVSGLVPSLPKSTAFFCNVLNHVKLSILNVLPFEEGRLPVKYLGVPLVSSRMLIKDCKELVDKIQNRVLDWRNKSLSIAGRLQLIRSVIGSMNVFWASVFMLPSKVLLDIEQIMRNFLWCPGDSTRGKSKVAWEGVCLPKDEGGLGIRRLSHFNNALMSNHIWNLLANKESLWVRWIHAYKLHSRNFWDIPIRGNMSCGWRNILRMRTIIRQFVWHKIGTGLHTSLWFDTWCDIGPLSNYISNRDIHRAGLNFNSKVSDIVQNGVVVWPRFLSDKYAVLSTCTAAISNVRDSILWRLSDGSTTAFSVSQVWNSIRPRDDKVTWYDMIWFPNNIPRHAFNLWLIVKHKLKTQDRISWWDASSSLGSACSLCEVVPDSHEHLFFDCPFAAQVWNHMKSKAGLDNVPNDVYAIIIHVGTGAKRKSTKIVIAKLVLAAAAYYLWQERNKRLFTKNKRSANQIIECISSVVRLKLLSCGLKRTKEGEFYARVWDLPNSVFR
ncbi:putative RNA-directed DNA polymerase [Tanacetum coccineum]